MTRAKVGDQVTIHFSAFLDDGTELESTEAKEPFQFVLGAGDVIAGLDGAVVGMSVGDKKISTLKPAEAFGERSAELIRPTAKSQFGDDMDLTPGARVGAKTPEGEIIELTVLSVEGDQVMLDANHPLAGLDVTYRIELIKVNSR